MDKEFLDKVLACKTAEELRALINGKRQLSVDEMEQVTGAGEADIDTKEKARAVAFR